MGSEFRLHMFMLSILFSTAGLKKSLFSVSVIEIEIKQDCLILSHGALISTGAPSQVFGLVGHWWQHGHSC